MSSTYSHNATDTNNSVLGQAEDDLTLDQQHQLHAHLLGSLAGWVDTETWARLVDASRAFVEHPTR